MQPYWQRPFSIVLLAVLLVTGTLVAAVSRIRNPIPARLLDPLQPAPTLGSMLRTGHTTELTMVVLGSRGCGASRGTELLAALLRLRDSLRATAMRRGLEFASIGIALDHNPSVGMRWISEIGGFDEVSAGQGWLNTEVAEYVWREPHGMGITPQVIIGIRSLGRATNKRIRPPVLTVLIRMMGPRDILTGVGMSDLDSLLGRSPSLFVAQKGSH